MKKIILLLFISCVVVYSSDASHLRAGQITVEQVPGSLDCKITVSAFTNTKNTAVLFGGDCTSILNFGDGSTEFAVPPVQNVIRLDFAPDGSVATASYIVFHKFAPGSYLIYYHEPNRNQGILNMDRSVDTEFYVETYVTISETGPPYQTPIILMDRPVLYCSVHANYSESLAAVDSNNYELYYDIASPQAGRREDVSHYVLPENLKIDHISGLLTWDTKFKGEYIAGEFAFAVKIYQIKDGVVMGYLHRDFQLILYDRGNANDPTVNGGPQSNGRVFAPESTTTKLRVEAGSALAKNIELQVESELTKFTDNFSYITEDSTHADINYKVAKITITNSDKIIRDTPYLISARGIFDSEVTEDLSYVIATKDISFDYQLPEIIAGVQESDASSRLSASPNPIKDFLEINNPGNEVVDVTIRDLTGTTVQQQTINTTALIDLHMLATGIYVCTLAKDNKIITLKIVKE